MRSSIVEATTPADAKTLGSSSIDAQASWIEKTPGECGGNARIRKTRIAVWSLVRRRESDLSDDDILASLPDLTPSDLAAAWKYDEQHQEEIRKAIQPNEEGLRQRRFPTIEFRTFGGERQAHESFEEWVEAEVLLLHRDHPEWLRLDGWTVVKGKWEIAGAFRHYGRVWEVHADTRFVPVLRAYHTLRSDPDTDPFIVQPAKTRVSLKLHPSIRPTGRGH